MSEPDPEIRPELWIEIEGSEGRWYILGRAHTSASSMPFEAKAKSSNAIRPDMLGPAKLPRLAPGASDKLIVWA
jgi:hypothetical protein